jgi:hypothetical protein
MRFIPKKISGIFAYKEFNVIDRELTLCCYEDSNEGWIAEIKGMTANIQDILLTLIPKVKKLLESMEILITNCKIYVIKSNETFLFEYDNEGVFKYTRVDDYRCRCSCCIK